MDTLFNGPKPLISTDLNSLTGGDEQITSSFSHKKVDGVFYTASAKVGSEDLKVTLSETEYLTQSTQFDLHPLIYFRLKKPLKSGQRLPAIDLKQVYGITSKFGFDLEIIPDLSYMQNSKIIE